MKKVKIALIIILPLAFICSIWGTFLKNEKMLKKVESEEVFFCATEKGISFGEVLEGILWNVPLPKELYPYELDLVEDNQVVFAYRFTYSDWGDMDELLIVNKKNQCKVINLLNEKCPDNQDPKILEFFDSLMQGYTYQFSKNNSDFTKEEFTNFINMPKASLEEETGGGLGDKVYFYVSGNQENRKINIMKAESDVEFILPSNKRKINDICQRLEIAKSNNAK